MSLAVPVFLAVTIEGVLVFFHKFLPPILMLSITPFVRSPAYVHVAVVPEMAVHLYTKEVYELRYILPTITPEVELAGKVAVPVVCVKELIHYE